MPPLPLMGETSDSVIAVLEVAIGLCETDEGPEGWKIDIKGLARAVNAALNQGATLPDALLPRLERLGIGIRPTAPPQPRRSAGEPSWAHVQALVQGDGRFVLGPPPAGTDRAAHVGGWTPLRVECDTCGLCAEVSLATWKSRPVHQCLCTTPTPPYTLLYSRNKRFEFENIRQFLAKAHTFQVLTSHEQFAQSHAPLALKCLTCGCVHACKASSVVKTKCPQCSNSSAAAAPGASGRARP